MRDRSRRPAAGSTPNQTTVTGPNYELVHRADRATYAVKVARGGDVSVAQGGISRVAVGE